MKKVSLFLIVLVMGILALGIGLSDAATTNRGYAACFTEKWFDNWILTSNLSPTDPDGLRW